MDFIDPLKVLEEVIGKPPHEIDRQAAAPGDGGGTGRPAELVEDIQFSGLGLNDFLENGDDLDGLDTRNSTTQMAEECEYVYSTMLHRF